MKLVAAMSHTRSPKFRERAGQSAFDVEVVPEAKRCFIQGAIGRNSVGFCDADGPLELQLSFMGALTMSGAQRRQY